MATGVIMKGSAGSWVWAPGLMAHMKATEDLELRP